MASRLQAQYERNDSEVYAVLIYLQMIETVEERSKFESVYLEYKDIMYFVAYNILKHPEDAEDAVHQAFVKIAENITKIGEPVSPKTKRYVSVIAETTAIDMWRRKNRHPVSNLEDVALGMTVGYEGDDLLAGDILNLPKQQRDVIWLKYYHGYTLREIAKMLNMSYAAVSKTDQRAKQKLREIFEQEGVLTK